MLEEIVTPLLLWYDGHARILPWRENPTPYRVWVSEIMLQQTRVEAVKPFYERFMDRLPDIRSLAECQEDTLLKLWEGLGYYNRVRNLKKAAMIIEERFGGRMPENYEDVISLPGIGPYTAGAVLSIAYGQQVPAVDGNVFRVVMRLTADDSDITKPSVRRKVEDALLQVMPEGRAGDFNQALMELGAVVCVPNGEAKCEECPLIGLCKGHRIGNYMDFPKKPPKKARRLEDKTVLVIRDGERLAIRKRTARGLLAGLYEFPNVEGHLSEEEALEQVKRFGLSPLRIQRLPEAKHIFSHVEWHMVGYLVRVAALEEETTQDFLFVEPDETEERYPIPAAFSAYTELLKIRLGQEKYQDSGNR